MVPVLSACPPIVTYQHVTGERKSAETRPRDSHSEIVRSTEISAARAVRPAPALVPVRERIDAIRPAPSLAPSVVTDSESAPAPAKSQEFRWDARIDSWMWSIWLAGVLVLTVRLIVGSLRLARLVRRSSAVPDAMVRECLAIADRLGSHRIVRLRQTAELATPCLARIVRPVLLLPERECENLRSDDLRAIFAHELTHARNHDLPWNLAAQFASILLWFHPLAWRIRAAHAAACDAVCDAVAVDLLGDVVSYGRVLARLAVRGLAVIGPRAGHGPQFRRPPPDRCPEPDRLPCPALLAACHAGISFASLVVALVGGFGFTRAEQAVISQRTEPAMVSPKPKPADEKANGKLTIRAVTAETKEPIEGVSIEYWVRSGERVHEATIFTAEDGTATMEWALGATVNTIGLTARAPKLVPVDILWDDQRHPIKLPETKELRFEPGTTIGGIVRDEAGQPIAGATVNVHGPPTETDRPNSAFTIGEVTTNAEGRWRIDVAPLDLSELWANVTHPRHRHNGTRVSRDLDSVITLKKGLTVKGHVVDAAGRPVSGARAVIGPSSWGPEPSKVTTDTQGGFILENCIAGPTIITIPAEGFAPLIKDLRIEERTAPVEIRMTEPGSVLRGRVVDTKGKPVNGVRVIANGWHGYRSIEFRTTTNDEGRFEWRTRPRTLWNTASAEQTTCGSTRL